MKIRHLPLTTIPVFQIRPPHKEMATKQRLFDMAEQPAWRLAGGCRRRGKHILRPVAHWPAQDLHEPANLTKCWVARFRSRPPSHSSTLPTLHSGVAVAVCSKYVLNVKILGIS